MSQRTDRIAALLADGVAQGVPGVAVTAVFPDGEIVSAAAGVRDAASGAEMRPDTVVWIASMTKAITAAGAMQLVDKANCRSTLRSRRYCRGSRTPRCWKASMRKANQCCVRRAARSL